MAAVEQAAQWLAAAGCELTEVEPPHFEEGAHLWRQLVMDDMRHGGLPAVEAMGDAGVRSARRGYLHGLAPLEAQQRRFNLCRDWAVFLEPEAVQRLLAAQSPLLGTALTGLPGLAVPTGVQLVAGRFREGRCLAAGALVEAAARFSALALLAPR